jgi:hypothetical protein
MAEENTHNTFVARLSAYPAVGYAFGKAKGCYNYAKENNSYIKASLETAEKYSHKLVYEYNHPTIDALLLKTDKYGCQQLDKIEHRGKQLQGMYDSVKPKTKESLDKVANKIHGTPVEHILLKTISSVDSALDVLFPPKDNEPAQVSQVPEDPNLVSQTAPIVNKLAERVSTESVKQLPFHVYSLTREYFYETAIPQLVSLLSAASQRVKTSYSTAHEVQPEHEGEERELQDVLEEEQEEETDQGEQEEIEREEWDGQERAEARE